MENRVFKLIKKGFAWSTLPFLLIVPVSFIMGSLRATVPVVINHMEPSTLLTARPEGCFLDWQLVVAILAHLETQYFYYFSKMAVPNLLVRSCCQ